MEGVGRFNKIPLQGATHESSVRGGTRESATRFSLGGEGGKFSTICLLIAILCNWTSALFKKVVFVFLHFSFVDKINLA